MDQVAQKTDLYETHIAIGAKIVSFSGFLMPLQYSGIIDEHNSVRNSVGLFDLSHMGEFTVRFLEPSIKTLENKDPGRHL